MRYAMKQKLFCWGDDYRILYAFRRHGREVATISKAYFSWTDSFGVDIADGEDAILILASTVVIDPCCHGDAQNRRA